MYSQEYKVFRDNVHGYIKVPYDYVVNIIDTEIFQRLRNIEQTGMRILYPSARHDRFIHSLGVYYLGHKAFKNFKNNVQNSYSGQTDSKGDHFHFFENDDDTNNKFWDFCQVLFELACLLHDCGHSPFSHTLEFHYDGTVEGISPLNEILCEYVGTETFRRDYHNHGAPHERMSALIVCTDFKAKIQDLLLKYDLANPIFGDPIEFVVRMIIGCKYSENSDIIQMKNCFVELLNSQSIDVDSLDYIIRDAKLSGIDNMNIDLNRLLGSLTLIEITEYNRKHLRGFELSANIINGKLSKNGQNAYIKGVCKGSLKIENNLKGTMSGAVYANGVFKTTQPINIDINATEKCVVSINGIEYENTIPTLPAAANMKIRGVLPHSVSVEGNEVTLDNPTNGHLDIFGDTITFHSTYVDGRINGIFSGEILGNHVKDIPNGKLKFTLGYHKSSLSIIQNVVIARNYEYQWVYSHHKVVYYSNYLLIDLLRKCAEYLIKRNPGFLQDAESAISNILSWNIMINHSEESEDYHSYDFVGSQFFRPTDYDILSLFKQCQILCKKEDDELLYKLLMELNTRKYRKSLWKSYAEFNMFLGDFSDIEKNQIFKKLVANSSYHRDNHYGYLNKKYADEFEKCGLMNVVWVNGDSKLKSLNPDSTYVLFKDKAITYRTISSSDSIQSIKSLNLFYLYYDSISEDQTLDTKGLCAFLRREIS